MSPLAYAVPSSQNSKTGRIAVTYAAQASCPTSCRFFNGGGCYAENGVMAMSTTGPLNAAAEEAGASALDVARAEASAIDAMIAVADRPMRLHSVGDCRTDEAARIVSAAAERYMDRGGGPVWTYTHAWQVVERASWGRVSVLASCETAEHVELARGRGYAPSIVVSQFRSHRRHFAAGTAILPCPAQTKGGVTCASCLLCANDSFIRSSGYAIAFEVHGTMFSVKRALAALETPNDPRRRFGSRDFIEQYLEEHGRWPTPRQVQDGADVGNSAAAEMLSRMRDEVGE